MKPTQILMEEHRTIERALVLLDSVAARISSGEPVSTDYVRAITHFLREYADRCHHMKEEDLLFPSLVSSGLPRDSGPISIMEVEHQEGRRLLRNLDDALEHYERGNKNSALSVCRWVRGSTAHLRAHIAKEDNVLFVMAEIRLTTHQKEALAEAFRRSEADGNACSGKRELMKLLDTLEAVGHHAEVA